MPGPPGLGHGGPMAPAPPPGLGPSSATGNINGLTPTGPPPGLTGLPGSLGPGSSSAFGSGPPGLGGQGGVGLGQHGAAGGAGGVTMIVKTQIVFLLNTLTEESYQKNAAEIRTLISQNGAEMYHHFLRRLVTVAAPILHNLQSQANKQALASPPPAPPGFTNGANHAGDRPLDRALDIPTTGAGVLAWRLLESEARRASRDVSLAGHFASILLAPQSSSNIPLLQLNLLQLPSNHLFSLACNIFNTPSQVIPSSSPLAQRALDILRQSYPEALEALRTQGRPFFDDEDLPLSEARAFILGVYPKTPEEGGPPLLPPSPNNANSVLSFPLPNSPPLTSVQKTDLLQALSIKFSSPAVVLQALQGISSGGPVGDPRAIRLEDMLFELGDALTSDESIVANVAAKWWTNLTYSRMGSASDKALEDEVAKVLRGLAEGLVAGRVVDIQGAVKGMASLTELEWAYIIQSFDQPTSDLESPLALPVLVAALTLTPPSPSSAVSGLLSQRWDNTAVFLRILGNLLALPSEVFAFSSSSAVKGNVTVEDLSEVSGEAQAAAGPLLHNSWNNQQVIDLLINIVADAGRWSEGAETSDLARDILEKGTQAAPELLMIGLVQVARPWSDYHSQTVATLLSAYLQSRPTSEIIFAVLGRTAPGFVVEALQDFYEQSELNVSRVVDIGQEAQVLDSLLSNKSFNFALDVASVASRRELVDLENWVIDGVQKYGETFLHAVLDFLDHKIHAEGSAIEGQMDTVALVPATFATYFRALRNSGGLAGTDIDHFKEIRNYSLQIHPRLMNLGPHAEGEPGLAVVQFPSRVDAQVDDFYQRMYAEEFSLDHVIKILKALRHSNSVEDHELFACMLHTLFDEYKFVHTYPPRELAMTGLVFGSIIQYRLIEGTPLHVAVRYVLDALQSPPESTMFNFGKNALNIFQSRLIEFPHMCRALLQIPYLHETNPLLISIIRTALTNRDVDGESASRPGSPGEEEHIIFTAIQPEELDLELADNHLVEPEEDVSDKILFILNNLAPSNFDSKMGDMKESFETKHSRWFASYLVNTRVSVEPNNHNLYLDLLQALAMPLLEKHVLLETYTKSLALLNSEKTMVDTQDKNVLKNMGSWLGRLTVARDFPIKHRHMAVKDLLIQGYDGKRLAVAIPFVCKIIEQCAKSRVFHPPNPWLIAMMRMLNELYQFAELKLNLKFEIEVLCKALNMDLMEIEPTNILRSRTPPVPAAQITSNLAQELDRITQGAAPAPGPQPRLTGLVTGDMSQQAIQDAFARRVDELIAQLPEYLIFGPTQPIFHSNAALKRIVHHSVDRAIREIITPVVERSVTIAGISSRDLLTKDFGLESDDGKLRQAAHLMVSKLAGSLALVTCKEPLRTSMTTNIRSTMLQSGFSEDTLPEQAIIGVVNDNLEVACAIIKNAAQEKAVTDIDVNLASSYTTRRQHRDAGKGFFEPSPFANVVSRSALPESLRLLPSGLQTLQMRVYEDFGDQSRFTMHAGPLGGSEGELGGPGAIIAGMHAGAALPRGVTGDVEALIMGTKLTNGQVLEKFQELIGELDKTIQQTVAGTLAEVSPHHELHSIVRQLPTLATQSANTDQTALAFSQKIVQLLYKSETSLSRDIYVVILQRLCELFGKVAKEVTQWLVYAEDNRKFNVPVTVALIRIGLINVPELDMQLAKVITRDFASPVINFTADLIRDCVLASGLSATKAQFAHCLDALVRAGGTAKSTDNLERLLDELQGRDGWKSASQAESPLPVGIRAFGSLGAQREHLPMDPELRANLSHHFLEWVRLFTSPLPVEASFVPFVNKLQKQGILKGEEISSAFYRNSIALAIEIYSQHKLTGSLQMFHGVDALSRLIVLLLKNYSDTHGVSSDSAKTLYFAKIFTIAALSLVRDHEQLGPGFEQRPYHRFFSSLLCDLQAIQSSFPAAYYGCLRTFANHLGSIQPSIAPAFAYSWISLISHRYFMPRLLQVANKEGWADFYRVLMALFKFLNPFLQAANLHAPSRILFKGTLRILLVILKDFPEFLVEHYIGLCAAIPTHCIQLRNVVLCAFPRGVTLRQDMESLSDLPPLPEFQVIPEVKTDYVRFLDEAHIRNEIDAYIERDVPNLQLLMPELRNRIAISVAGADGSPEVTYNLTLLYSVSLYLGVSAVNRSKERTGSVRFDAQAPEVVLMTALVLSLDGEGQHHFINSVVNQLRFPSAHTFFFMLYILHLFSEASNLAPGSDIPERITRVLLERVIAQRPHPWGLTTTFSELLHNEKLGFWEHEWVGSEPELFSIFQRCLGRKV